MKFYTIVGKGLKLRVRKFWWLILTFEEVTGGKLVGGAFLGGVKGVGGAFGPPPPPSLNRFNKFYY